MEPKFDECLGCRFFRPNNPRPECGECGNGEFYDPKTRHLEAGYDPADEFGSYLKDLRRYE